jgi:serine/threonine protein kinase/WD40 repeat protein
MSLNRNLLLGFLAVDMKFISRDVLEQVLRTWKPNSALSLVEVLSQQGHLTHEQLVLVEDRLRQHLQANDNDLQKSWETLSLNIEGQSAFHPALEKSLDALSAKLEMDSESPSNTNLHGQPSGAETWVQNPSPNPFGEVTPQEAGNRFRILRPHAKGGLGEVFIAEDMELHREVALKEIQLQHAYDANSRGRFLLEAEVTGGLEHPGIVPVYGLGTYPDGRPFYAMRFIRGESLKEAIEKFHQEDGKQSDSERNLAFRNLLKRFIDVCNALEYAHSRGILHRDIKPANIMLGSYGETLVVDWGLAKRIQQSDIVNGSQEKIFPKIASGSYAETQAGSIIGTPAYMSPEQATGRVDEMGPASDIYSLGATLYTIVTGKAPFEGHFAQLVLHIDSGNFPSPKSVKESVPVVLNAIVLQAMARKPPERYSSAGLLAKEIEQFLADEPVEAYRESSLEKRKRWARKHPGMVASIFGALFVGVVGLVIGSAILSGKNQELSLSNQQLEDARIDAENKRIAAEEGLKREEKLRQLSDYTLYRNRIVYALRELENLNYVRAEEILDQCQEKYRQFEWRLLKNRCQTNNRSIRLNTAFLNEINLSPDGKILAIGLGYMGDSHSQAEVELRDSTSFELIRKWTQPGGGFTRLHFSPDGQSIEACQVIFDLPEFLARKHTVSELTTTKTYRWSISDGKLLDSQADFSVRILRSEGRLEAKCEEKNRVVSIRDNQSGKEIFRTPLLAGQITNAILREGSRQLLVRRLEAFDPNAKKLVESHSILWDIDSKQILFEQSGEADIQFVPGEKQLIYLNSKGEIFFWDIAQKRNLFQLKGMPEKITTFSFIKNAQGRLLLATGSNDRAIRIWDIAEQKILKTLQGHRRVPNSIVFSSDQNYLYSGDVDGTLQIWNWQFDGNVRDLDTRFRSAAGLAFIENDLLVVPGSQLHLMDLKTNEAIFLPEGNDRNISFSRKAGFLAAGGENEFLLFDMKKRDQKGVPQRLDLLKTEPGWNRFLTLNESGDRLYSVRFGTQEKASVIYFEAREVPSGKLLWSHETSSHLFAIACSHDGKVLCTHSLEQEVVLWEANTGKAFRQLLPPVPPSFVFAQRSVAFHPQDEYIAASTGNSSNPNDYPDVAVWDRESGSHRGFHGHDALISDVAFSPDGKRLATVSVDVNRGHLGELKLWDIETGEEMLTLPGARSVAFSEDGQRLACLHFCEDGLYCVRVWNPPSLKSQPKNAKENREVLPKPKEKTP